MPRDPRWYQIAVLSGLLLYGKTFLDFDVSWPRIALLLGAALFTQWAFQFARVERFDPRSALISALSLCLLLRTNSALVAVFVAAATIGSKFVLRVGGKHVFNPTNFGIVLALALGLPAWVSPGQWGHVALFGFLMASLGTVVVTRAARADVTFGFLAAYLLIVFGRAAWLGQPSANPFHQLQSGGLLLFSFFMISDPRTTPDTRAGRLVFAVLVAAGAAFVPFVLYRTNGLLWSLALLSPLVPVLDRLLPGRRHAWPSLPRLAPAAAAALLAMAGATSAQAFCGFYVAQSDAKLYNKSSQVVLARDGDRTVVTLSNDYEGDLEEFALVVPVAVVPQKDQVHVGEGAWIEHLDRFTAPRLVDDPDPDPCPDEAAIRVSAQRMMDTKSSSTVSLMARGMRTEAVRVEAQYTVGEYDIVILSATQSGALLAWLQQHGYRVPAKAQKIVGTYLRQGLKFFVAKVNLGEQSKLASRKLRPLQIAYESPRFMLPIRLGMVNANGPQELFVYTLTPHGRVETTNYRVVKMPTGNEVPLFVRDDFVDFARATFDRQVAKEGMRTVFLEHAWNASWCDPCAGPPLDLAELRQLGASWIENGNGQVFVTRLHARYDAASFPEDLVFQETANAENFQSRYVMRPPFKGDCNCPAGAEYRKALAARHEAQRQELVELTGWTPARVRQRMAAGPDAYLPTVTVNAPLRWGTTMWHGLGLRSYAGGGGGPPRPPPLLFFGGAPCRSSPRIDRSSGAAYPAADLPRNFAP
jgi:hypothetical protein